MQNSLKISLPKTKGATSNASPADRLVVSINAAGKTFVNDTEVSSLKLVGYLKGKVASSADKTVVVKADKSLVYDKVIQIIDQVSGVEGVQNVALAAELGAQRV